MVLFSYVFDAEKIQDDWWWLNQPLRKYDDIVKLDQFPK